MVENNKGTKIPLAIKRIETSAYTATNINAIFI
jgi:hypothetical protein